MKMRLQHTLITIIFLSTSLPGYTATSITYTYNAVAQLESATRSDGPSISYAYDAVDNFTSQTSTTPLDTDNDRLSNAIEIAYGLNINLRHTDNDDISDYDEVCYDGNCSAYNPYDPVTNPTGTDLDANKTDTDGDGYSDGLEISLATNPLDANSIPATSVNGGSYRYTILNPELIGAEAWVVSLSDGNIITAGNTGFALNRYQRAKIPAGVLTQDLVVSGTGPFDMGSSSDATDVPPSRRLAGTSFVMPHVRFSHLYYLLSPQGAASVQVNVNGLITPLSLPQGQVVEFDAGYGTTGTTLITSDLPILVSHLGNAGASYVDASPVPPAALELWGVRTTLAVLGALEDNTIVNIYADNGSQISNIKLNAGQRYVISGGVVSGIQGTGSAVRILANKPVGAVQIGDSDGSEQTAFMPTSVLGIRFGLPTNTQYVAVVCPTANTTVTLNSSLVPAHQIICNGNGMSPGKAYFGSTTNGIHFNAGDYLESDHPVFVMYEDALTNDEHNLMGQGIGSHTYTILNPRMTGVEAWVVSLMDGNIITAGNTVLTLNQYERAPIPAGILSQKMVVSGTGPFDMGSSTDGTDMPLSNRLAGTAFVMPQVRYTHLYYLLSSQGNATAQINVNGVLTSLSLTQGQVVEFNAGYDASGTALITSDIPILVSHLGNTGTSIFDASPVPPAALELWGVRSTNAIVGALENNTTVNIYADDGSQVSNVVLDAGQRYTITAGVSNVQGTGSGLHILADKPVGAIQIADADGGEQTAFFPTSQLGDQFGLPTAAQYIAVVCPTANTSVTLYNGTNPPQSILCNASGLTPGKVYFGATTNGSNISAWSYLKSDKPVYVIYEDAISNDEHNLMGSPSAGL
ncbi:MAG: hypothetical protein L3J75_01350 [Methylococcaceae bacterium]|nr:hypothetical protein [Methylococcaceae bacterium]